MNTGTTLTVPPLGAAEDQLLAWANRAIEEARRFLYSQPSYRDMENIREVLEGNPSIDTKISGQQIPIVNFVQRNGRELVATLTNLNPRWGYNTDSEEYRANAAVLNKCFQGWWSNTYADRRIKEALQYALLNSGYLQVRWNPNFWSFGRGDIELVPISGSDVMPLMPPKDGDFQKAYAVVIREEVPVTEAWQRYPQYQHKIVPTRNNASWIKRIKGGVDKFTSPVLSIFGNRSNRNAEITYPTVDIYHIYVNDYAINTSGKSMFVGEPDRNWSYEVPSLNSDIPSGIFDPYGNPLFRKATEQDARLFPRRRLIVTTGTCILRDGPSPWWHGMVPLVKFDLYRWIWNYLGMSVIRGGLGLQDAHNRIFATIVDSAEVRLDPPLGYDDKVHSRSLMERLNLRKPGQRLAMDFQMGDTIKPLLDPRYYDQPQWIDNLLQRFPELINHQMGVMDMSALAKAAQIPSDNTIEKLLQVNGPLVADHAREMERSLYGLGVLVRDLFFQFYTTKRRIEILGRDGVVSEDFDFEPGAMVPSHMPGENTGKPSMFGVSERARRHAQNFYFHITPNSSYNITDISRQLLFLQLWRDGRIPMDPQTVAEALNIPNFGKPFEGTVFERWMQWKQAEAQSMIAQQATVMAGQAALNPMGILAEGLAGMASGQTAPQGRPPTGNEAPKIERKTDSEGFPRTTITES